MGCRSVRAYNKFIKRKVGTDMNDVAMIMVASGLVKVGDHLHITPNEKLPNFDRDIIVQGITDEGFKYGITETSDGYLYPWWAIEDFEIVRDKK